MQRIAGPKKADASEVVVRPIKMNKRKLKRMPRRCGRSLFHSTSGRGTSRDGIYRIGSCKSWRGPSAPKPPLHEGYEEDPSGARKHIATVRERETRTAVHGGIESEQDQRLW